MPFSSLSAPGSFSAAVSSAFFNMPSSSSEHTGQDSKASTFATMVLQWEEDYINHDLLISLVEERVALWDTRHRDHSDMVVHRQEWNEVTKELMDDWDNSTPRAQKDFRNDQVKTRWRLMKDHFNKDTRTRLAVAVVMVHQGSERAGACKITWSSTLEPALSSGRSFNEQPQSSPSHPPAIQQQQKVSDRTVMPKFLHLSSVFQDGMKSMLNYYLRTLSVKGPSGTDIFDRGYVKGNFDILNFIASSNKRIKNVLVGSWFSSAHKQLQINESAIVWNPHFKETPRSLCTDPCSPGYRQSPGAGKLSCCFECVQCNDGEFTNGTALESCMGCPDDQWSNPTRDKCIKRPLQFLSYEEDLGLSLAITATILFGMASSVLWVFIKFRNTPLVRANNCNLSYVLLVSLIICFLLSFLFIGQPKEATCLMRQTTFGIIFAVAISSVLGKTTTVLIAFNATKPGSKFKKRVGSRISTGLVILCSLGEFLISMTWLIYSPPFVHLDTKSIPGITLVQCNEGSIIAFYAAVSYIGVLAVFSFVIAFISRKLPDTFNEAQYITFSMLVFCSVWISFIPTYLSTNGKYMVAVEIFAILASSGALLCFIFFPKCYIILLQPENNKKSKIIVKMFKM
ncbi:vomeronasal type-2 receptor 26-like [Dendrobates tinctorius]|uniref:vomeronasal type-2 receptor 26-like n=1 Tax=Dendrobates tinctorius TaxID=92724 RepID=UPI003CCA19F4